MTLQIPLKLLTLLFATTIILSACTTNEENNTPETPITSPIVTEDLPLVEDNVQEEELEPAAEPKEEAPKQPSHAVDPSELPSTKDLEFLLEGMTEKVAASLTLSDQGYGFYLMDGFDFATEEPGRDIIFSQAFPDYFATIELLPANSNVEEVKAYMREQLKATGDVVELSREEINELVRDNVSFFIHSSNSDLSQSMMLFDAGNSFFLIAIHLPSGEALEGISQRFYPMIGSLVVTK